ncbi:MAG: hypothetical protein M3Y33_06220 [Actinomycetota bacterium]|nr:hypothetical protein [Actinomycetota bacterium]
MPPDTGCVPKPGRRYQSSPAAASCTGCRKFRRSGDRELMEQAAADHCAATGHQVRVTFSATVIFEPPGQPEGTL